MDFIGIIAIATKAIEGLKLLRGLEKTFDEASFKMQIADITSNLADLKIALVEAKSEAAEKDAEISRLKKSLSGPKAQSRLMAIATKNRAPESRRGCRFATDAKKSTAA
jgi:hypothetical protein